VGRARHRERATHTLLDLRERDELRGALDVRPRQVQSLAATEREQRVPRRIEDDLLPDELGRVLVRTSRPLARLTRELVGERPVDGQTRDVDAAERFGLVRADARC